MNYPQLKLNHLNIVGKYGADALRLYLINSPVVRAENLRFKEEGVRDVLKEVFLPWYNAYRFLVQNILQFTKEKEISYKFDSSLKSTNVMDKWILSFAQSLLKFVHQEMAAYHLYTVVPQLIKFIDNLTNWYVRMNRRRFRGENGVDDCQQALTTLTDVLFVMIRIMSPFTPFFSEFIYQNFRFLFSEYEQSIHYLMLPSPRTEIIDESIERAVSRMQIVIELGRIVRDRKTLPLKFPLKEIVIIHNDADFLQDIENMSHYIKEELNVRKVTTSANKEKYGVSLKAEPDHKVLGSKLKSAFKDVMAIIKQLTNDQIQEFLKNGNLTVENYTFETGDLRIISSFTGLAAKELSQKYEAHSEKNALILLDVTPDQALQEEGIAREIINRVQKLRKKAHVIPTDPISVHYTITPADSDLSRIANEHAAFISTAIKVPFINSQPLTPIILGENQELRNANLYLMLARKEEEDNAAAVEPNCRYVNVILNGVKPRYGTKSVSGTILLENPAGENFLSYDQLLSEVTRLFGMHGQRLILKDSSNTVIDEKHMDNLHKKTVFIEPYYCRKYISSKFTPHSDLIFSRFINIIYENKLACILTENPKGREFIEDNADHLVHAAGVIFNRKFKSADIKIIDKHTMQLIVS